LGTTWNARLVALCLFPRSLVRLKLKRKSGKKRQKKIEDIKLKHSGVFKMEDGIARA